MNNRLVVLAILLLCLFLSNHILGFIYYHATGGHCVMSSDFQAKTKTLASKVSRILREKNITHWADIGTLLGGVREKDMIAHDNDFDIGAFEWDVSRIKQAVASYEDTDLKAVISSLDGLPFLRIFNPNYPMDTRFPHVDINSYTVNSDKTIMWDVAVSVDSGKKKYPTKWLGPNLRPSPECTVELGTIRVPAVCEKMTWLRHHFGEGFMDKAIPRWQDCRHGITSYIYGYKF